MDGLLGGRQLDLLTYDTRFGLWVVKIHICLPAGYCGLQMTVVAVLQIFVRDQFPTGFQWIEPAV